MRTPHDLMPMAPLVALLVLAALVVGCAAQPPAGERDEESAGEEEAMSEEPQAPRPQAAPGVVTDEVPEELMSQIRADLANHTGAEASAPELVRAEAVTWNDASMGCGEPGMMYAQMLVEGYWVVLRHGGKEYDYRANRGGSFQLCEQENRRGPLPGAS